jgi:anthranilate synthase component 2
VNIERKILFIDNYDSFTYNLVDEFEKRNCQVTIFRNDLPFSLYERTINEDKPFLIVLSPGPSHPAGAGSCIELIQKYHGTLPFFGVCLGHQCIIEALGGTVGPAGEIIHGKIWPVTHNGRGIYRGLPSPLMAGRYHSLAGTVIPHELEVTAQCGDVVMSVQHRRRPIIGVQYHPESILTAAGDAILRNLFALIEESQ